MLDILQDNTGDVAISSNDISYGESTTQHIRDILIARPGDFRMHPDMGVGMENFIDDDGADFLKTAAEHLTRDGLSITTLTYTDVKGHY